MRVPPIDAMSEPIALVYGHWRDLLGPDGRLPAIRDLDLDRIKSTLPQLWLLGVECGPPVRFRYRVIGENIYRMAARQIHVGDVIADTVARDGREHIQSRLLRVVETREPDHYAGSPYARHTSEVIRIERIAVPFAADGRTVDRILNCTVADWNPGYRPPQPPGAPE
jgi:hypothetical protein